MVSYALPSARQLTTFNTASGSSNPFHNHAHGTGTHTRELYISSTGAGGGTNSSAACGDDTDAPVPAAPLAVLQPASHTQARQAGLQPRGGDVYPSSTICARSSHHTAIYQARSSEA
jgi:hypothetical protein